MLCNGGFFSFRPILSRPYTLPTSMWNTTLLSFRREEKGLSLSLSEFYCLIHITASFSFPQSQNQLTLIILLHALYTLVVPPAVTTTACEFHLTYRSNRAHVVPRYESMIPSYTLRTLLYQYALEREKSYGGTLIRLERIIEGIMIAIKQKKLRNSMTM